MTITLLNPERFDTRGLPEGMDPDKLYRYRYDTLASEAVGFESFLYKLIPYSLVRSVAFAIDPTHRFKVAPGTITAANRTKYRMTASILHLRRVRTNKLFTASSSSPNYKNVQVCWSPQAVVTSNTADPEIITALTRQEPLVDHLKDTTSRTRLIGSDQGELEFFKSDLNVPSRTSRYKEYMKDYTAGGPQSTDCSLVGGSKNQLRTSEETRWQSFEPSASTLSTGTFNAFKAQEIAFCKELSLHYRDPLMKNCNPFNRDYSLTRNVAELKDLTRSMLSVRKTADDLKKLWSSLRETPKVRDKIFDLSNNAASNIPGEYLSFHFGWKQLYKDLHDLLHLPEKLSKRINFLISRSGKASSYRSERKSISGVSGVSGFTYDTGAFDFDTSSSSRVERESVTRLVINAKFDFPPANVPHLRERLFFDKIGLIPRFTDVYNIIPWSWLVDWFTGFGNYLELIEEINHDPSLINWGLITSNTRGKLITEFRYKNRTRTSSFFNGSGAVTDTMSSQGHTSILEYECQTRQNVASATGVKLTTIPSSLTAYQLSILGAILAQRIDNTRGGTFRPRS